MLRLPMPAETLRRFLSDIKKINGSLGEESQINALKIKRSLEHCFERYGIVLRFMTHGIVIDVYNTMEKLETKKGRRVVTAVRLYFSHSRITAWRFYRFKCDWSGISLEKSYRVRSTAEIKQKCIERHFAEFEATLDNEEAALELIKTEWR